MPALSGVAAAELLAAWLRHGALALLVVGCRCGPLLLAVPLLGVLGRGVALLLGTLLLAPLVAPALPASLGGPTLLGLGAAIVPLCLRELLIGGTLTLAAALPWAVAQSVGSLLEGGRPRPGIATCSRQAAPLYGVLALALFFGLGGARTALTALAASYELVPLTCPPHPVAGPDSGSPAGSAQGLILLSARLLWLALRLAVPLLFAQLLAELLLALPGRWLGQHRPSPRPSPVRSLIGFGVLLLGAHALFPEFRKLLILWPALLSQALAPR